MRFRSTAVRIPKADPLTPEPVRSGVSKRSFLLGATTLVAASMAAAPMAHASNNVGPLRPINNLADVDDPTKAGLNINATIFVASIVALEAVTPVVGSAAYLTAAGRSGVFAWNPTNLSAQVTADSLQGIYIAPASDGTGASGAWVRQFVGNSVVPDWWGAIANDNTKAVTNAAAFVAAFKSGYMVFTSKASNYYTQQIVPPANSAGIVGGATLTAAGTITEAIIRGSTPLTNFVIEGMTFIMDTTVYTFQLAIYLTTPTNATIVNNVTTSGIILRNGSTNCKIIGNDISGFTGDGIQVDTGTTDGLWIERNKLHDGRSGSQAQIAFTVGSTYTNAFIRDNECLGKVSSYSIQLPGTITGLEVCNNSVEQSISVPQAVTRFVISGNIVNGTSSSFGILCGGSHGVISDNLTYETVLEGIAAGAGIGVDVHDNVMEWVIGAGSVGTDLGFSCEGTAGNPTQLLNFHHNTIINAAKAGIAIPGDVGRSNFSDNTIIDCGRLGGISGSGIYDYQDSGGGNNTNNTICRNRINNVNASYTTVGIYLAANTVGEIVEGNYLSTIATGVTDLGTNNVIRNNDAGNNTPMVSARFGSVAATTVITGYSKDTDAGGDFNATTGVFTVPSGFGGYYRLGVTVQANGAAATQAVFRKNSVPGNYSAVTVATTNSQAHTDGILRLAVGDVIDAQIIAGTSSAGTSTQSITIEFLGYG